MTEQDIFKRMTKGIKKPKGKDATADPGAAASAMASYFEGDNEEEKPDLSEFFGGYPG